MVAPPCGNYGLMNMLGIHREKKRNGRSWLPGREQQRGLKGKYKAEEGSLTEFLKNKVWS